MGECTQDSGEILGAHRISREPCNNAAGTWRRRQAGNARCADRDGLVGMLQRLFGVLQEVQRQRQLVVRLCDAPVICLQNIMATSVLKRT